jgi:5-formyltetrahydrofolate cyclo-ligase
LSTLSRRTPHSVADTTGVSGASAPASCDDGDMTVEMTASKKRWRAHLLAARRIRPAEVRARERRALSDHLLRWFTDASTAAHRPLTVCAYLPLPSEPLDPDLPYLLARSGFRVLAPVVVASGEPPDWCELPPRRAPDSVGVATSKHDVSLVPGPFGILEPTGPRLGPGAIRRADVVLVPALAVDRAGFRLGRGGGFYDRTLALLRYGAPGDQHRAKKAGPKEDVIPAADLPALVAVVFDDEADRDIPHEAHDVAVTHVATPAVGVRRLG